MTVRCSRINAFTLPALDWLVPAWRQAVTLNHVVSDDGLYRGPLYFVLTDHDAVVLVRHGPEDEPGAVAMVTRFTLDPSIRPASAQGEVRAATAAEQAEALRQLDHSSGVWPLRPVWMVGQLGFCVHAAPWLVSVFQFRDGQCVATTTSSERQRIQPLSEE